MPTVRRDSQDSHALTVIIIKRPQFSLLCVLCALSFDLSGSFVVNYVFRNSVTFQDLTFQLLPNPIVLSDKADP